jgi:Sulfatase
MMRAVRIAIGMFCWMTAMYAFLSAGSFTYQQFLRPRVFAWVGWFSDHHAQLYWVWLAAAAASLVPEWRSQPFARRLTLAFVAVWTFVGLLLAVRPVLPTLIDTHRSIVVGLVALLPLVWLAAIDYAAAGDYIRRPAPSVDIRSIDSRLCTAVFGTALFIVVLYAALTPVWIGGGFEPDLLTTGLLVGISWSAIGHLLIFGGVFLLFALLERAIRPFSFEFRLAATLVVIVLLLASILQRVVNMAIGLDDLWGYAAAVGLSVTMVATWTGLRLRRREMAPATAFDVIFGPAPLHPTPRRTAGALLVVAAAAFVLSAAAGRIDWDFLLLKLAVLFAWVAAFAVIYRATPADLRLGTPALVAACVLPLAGHVADRPLQARLPIWLGMPGSSIRHTLERYIVYNPSFRLVDDLLRDRPSETPSFDRTVRANTGLAEQVQPISIDFVPHLQPAASPPHIFWFVIDSLRDDYLAPYNDAVGFTPNISAFARESLVFHNAFTRYGGTGLSMSAMWMGAAGPHKQYVQPFAPMNALEKLLQANGYRRYISIGHIMQQLLTPSPDLVPLDAGVPELEFDFCRTLEEVEADVQKNEGDRRPIFAHTRSLNLHVAAIKSGSVPAGEVYPGFHPPYAARVHRIDGCFGRFIAFLKSRSLFDSSIVILTSDHGEMLGEDRQWGHAYYLYPQVLQTPLLMHIPANAARSASLDLSAAAFSTDLTPTMYAMLGYRLERASPLLGRSLVDFDAAGGAAARRRGTEVVAASYGAVWGALSVNGHRLYVADANHGREYAYERPARGEWAAVAVTAGIRARGQRAIRQEIARIAAAYHLSTANR